MSEPVQKPQGEDSTKCLARSVAKALAEDSSLEAVTINRTRRTVSVATLGKTDDKKLSERITRTIEQAEKLFYNGVEKIVLNNAAHKNPQLITEIANRYGNQAVVVSIDYKSGLLGKTSAYTLNGSENIKKSPVEFLAPAARMARRHQPKAGPRFSGSLLPDRYRTIRL